MKALLGRKVGMTQLTNDKGELVPVTLVQAGPCVVTRIRTTDRDGYSAAQIGWGEDQKLPKSVAGQFQKVKSAPAVVQEVRLAAEEIENLKAGDVIAPDVFAVGDAVQVSGISRGKGFAGTIKRHNFSRGPKTHGSRSYRRPGSIGSMYPQKVWRGKKMAGRLGAAKTTIKNLQVADVVSEDNIVAIAGAIPGPKKGMVLIRG